jgi:MFS family permease
VHQYLQLLRIEGALPAIVATFFARIGFGMIMLSLVIFIAQEAGYGVAGAVSAVTTLAMATSAPWKGHLVDLSGPFKMQCITGVGTFISVGFLLFSAIYLPLWVIVIAGALVGLSDPANVVVMRNLWWKVSDLDRIRMLGTSFEGVASPIAYSLAPLLAGFLVLSFSPAIAVAAGGLISGVATLGFAAQKRIRHWKVERNEHEGRAKITGKKNITLLMMIYSMLFAAHAALIVALVSFSEHVNQVGLSGFLLAGVSGGVLIGSLYFGTSRHAEKPKRAIERSFLMIFFVGLALTFSSKLLLVALLVFFYGLCRGPIPAASNFLVVFYAGDKSAGKAIGLLSSAIFIGQTLGYFLGGVLIEDFGFRAGFAVMAVAAPLALVAAFFLPERPWQKD